MTSLCPQLVREQRDHLRLLDPAGGSSSNRPAPGRSSPCRRRRTASRGTGSPTTSRPVPPHDAREVRAARVAQVALAALVLVRGEHVEAAPDRRAVAGRDVVERLDVAAAHPVRVRRVRRRRLARDRREAVERERPGRSRAAPTRCGRCDQLGSHAGDHAVRDARCRVAGHDVDVLVTGQLADVREAVGRLLDLSRPARDRGAGRREVLARPRLELRPVDLGIALADAMVSPPTISTSRSPCLATRT